MVSIFGSLNVGEMGLKAHSVALQTTGQNIANASNEAFHRQRVFMNALPATDYVTYRVGTGVEVARIGRVVDMALETLIRDAKGDLERLNVLRNALVRLETVFNEFGDGDLSSALSHFWDAVGDFSSNVSDSSVRRSVVLAAESLADNFNHFAETIRTARKEQNEYVKSAVGDINRISSSIADLNKHIAVAEDGGLQIQDASDLRDQRDALVEELSGIISVKANESSSGMLQVYTGSEFLVFDTNVYELSTRESTDNGLVIDTVHFSNGMELEPLGGKLKGFLEARDEVLPGYLSKLDTLAGTLAYEFNKIHSTGRGLDGYTSISGTTVVSDPALALSNAGLPFEIKNGSFNILVKNETTGLTQTTNVKVDLTGTGSDTTLQSLAAALAAADPALNAAVTGDNRLEISSSDSSLTFSFSEDTSGALAALGIATFFTGTGAESLKVNSLVADNLDFLAGALSDEPGDNTNALKLLDLRDMKVFANDTETAEEYYLDMVGTLGTESASFQNRAANQEILTQQMLNERQAISGVNLDEEAINLVQYQHAFQAAAKYLSVISQMMDVLVNM